MWSNTLQIQPVEQFYLPFNTLLCIFAYIWTDTNQPISAHTVSARLAVSVKPSAFCRRTKLECWSPPFKIIRHNTFTIVHQVFPVKYLYRLELVQPSLLAEWGVESIYLFQLLNRTQRQQLIGVNAARAVAFPSLLKNNIVFFIPRPVRTCPSPSAPPPPLPGLAATDCHCSTTLLHITSCGSTHTLNEQWCLRGRKFIAAKATERKQTKSERRSIRQAKSESKQGLIHNKRNRLWRGNDGIAGVIDYFSHYVGKSAKHLLVTAFPMWSFAVFKLHITVN